MQQKPFAPFAQVIHLIRTAPVTLNTSLFLFCGKEALTYTKASLSNGQLALCLPFNTQVTDYRWPIEGLKIILVDTGGLSLLQFKKIAHALLKQNPKLLVLDTALIQPIEIY